MQSFDVHCADTSIGSASLTETRDLGVLLSETEILRWQSCDPNIALPVGEVQVRLTSLERFSWLCHFVHTHSLFLQFKPLVACSWCSHGDFALLCCVETNMSGTDMAFGARRRL